MKDRGLPRSLAVLVTAMMNCVLLVSASSVKHPVVQAPERPVYSPTGAEGSVAGTIVVSGGIPTAKRIDMSGDSNCPKTGLTQDIKVADGKLANAFVYVRGVSLDRYSFPTPDWPVVMDQKRCQFAPRVLGIQIGQTLKISNSDSTTHNVHPSPRLNAEWNQSQPALGDYIEKKFNRSEIMIPVKCNQHPWMRAYVGVMAHPFFSVSSRDGSYKIEGLPPGDYVVVAWHEVFGQKETTITVSPNEPVTLNISFGEKSARNWGVLPLAPVVNVG